MVNKRVVIEWENGNAILFDPEEKKFQVKGKWEQIVAYIESLQAKGYDRVSDLFKGG